MRPSATHHHRWFDRAGVLLSLACAVHCTLGGLLVASLASVGAMFGGHQAHQIGLVLAILIGGGALWFGVGAGRSPRVVQLGVAGLALMALALIAPHDRPMWETLLTLAGAALLALAHVLNLRTSRKAAAA